MSHRVIEASESTVMGFTVEEFNGRSRKKIKARKENVLGAIIGSLSINGEMTWSYLHFKKIILIAM